MNAFAESFLSRLRPILLGFASRVTAANPELAYDLGATENDVFLLRVYLSFQSHGDGDEVAVTVDVNVGQDGLTVVSDICTGSGQIIAVGPATTCIVTGELPISVDALTTWLSEFDWFLRHAEAQVVQSTSALP